MDCTKRDHWCSPWIFVTITTLSCRTNVAAAAAVVAAAAVDVILLMTLMTLTSFSLSFVGSLFVVVVGGTGTTIGRRFLLEVAIKWHRFRHSSSSFDLPCDGVFVYPNGMWLLCEKRELPCYSDFYSYS